MGRKEKRLPVGEFEAVRLELLEEGKPLMFTTWNLERRRVMFTECAAKKQPYFIEWTGDDEFWFYYKDGFEQRLLFRRME